LLRDNTIAPKGAQVEARELAAYDTLSTGGGRDGRGALSELAGFVSVDGGACWKCPSDLFSAARLRAWIAEMRERAPQSMRKEPAGKCYFWMLWELGGSGLMIAAAASVSGGVPWCSSARKAADLGLEKPRAGRWARSTDAPKANVGLLNYLSLG
jgi:hypothetical protein